MKLNVMTINFQKLLSSRAVLLSRSDCRAFAPPELPDRIWPSPSSDAREMLGFVAEIGGLREAIAASSAKLMEDMESLQWQAAVGTSRGAVGGRAKGPRAARGAAPGCCRRKGSPDSGACCNAARERAAWGRGRRVGVLEGDSRRFSEARGSYPRSREPPVCQTIWVS
jgi:hypothetical protein